MNKIIGGKRYTYVDAYSSKTEAKQKAEKLRATGKLVRIIVNRSGEHRRYPSYQIWAK